MRPLKGLKTHKHEAAEVFVKAGLHWVNFYRCEWSVRLSVPGPVYEQSSSSKVSNVSTTTTILQSNQA